MCNLRVRTYTLRHLDGSHPRLNTVLFWLLNSGSMSDSSIFQIGLTHKHSSHIDSPHCLERNHLCACISGRGNINNPFHCPMIYHRWRRNPGFGLTELKVRRLLMCTIIKYFLSPCELVNSLSALSSPCGIERYVSTNVTEHATYLQMMWPHIIPSSYGS